MLTGFEEFVMRGDVLDLAITIMIGTASASIVDAITSAIINPLIALLGGDREIGFAVQLLEGNPETVMDFGMLITATCSPFARSPPDRAGQPVEHRLISSRPRPTPRRHRHGRQGVAARQPWCGGR